MDIERAREIFNAAEIITVLHEGSPVWIENLSMEENTAVVKPLDGRSDPFEIPVGELVEG